MTDNKEKEPKTPDEELARAKSDRKFDIGFFLVILSILTVVVILRIKGVITFEGVLKSWYSCDGAADYFSGAVGEGIAGLITAVIMYLFAPLIALWFLVMGLGYAPYDAFIRKPKEIKALEAKIREQNETAEYTEKYEQIETDKPDSE